MDVCIRFKSPNGLDRGMSLPTTGLGSSECGLRESDGGAGFGALQLGAGRLVDPPLAFFLIFLGSRVVGSFVLKESGSRNHSSVFDLNVTPWAMLKCAFLCLEKWAKGDR